VIGGRVGQSTSQLTQFHTSVTQSSLQVANLPLQVCHTPAAVHVNMLHTTLTFPFCLSSLFYEDYSGLG